MVAGSKEGKREFSKMGAVSMEAFAFSITTDVLSRIIHEGGSTIGPSMELGPREARVTCLKEESPREAAADELL